MYYILVFMTVTFYFKVDAVHMEKDIYSGELKGNPINILNALLTEIFLPLIRAKKEWGQCTEDHKQYLLQNLEKTVSNLSEPGGTSLASKHVVSQYEPLASHNIVLHNANVIYVENTLQSYIKSITY